MLKIKNNANGGKIKVKVYGYNLEGFINSLIEDGIKFIKVRKREFNCVTLTVDERVVSQVKNRAISYNCKVEIIWRSGIGKILENYKGRISFVIGFIFFLCTIWVLNSIVWEINVVSEKYISPFEIKEILNDNNVYKGMKKGSIDLNHVEKIVRESNEGIEWVDAQLMGGKLIVRLKEREELFRPLEEREPCSIVASKDGVISRIYSAEGEIVVEPGDIVKKGDILIAAIQGKEGKEYLVHSQGRVVAKTFYERSEIVKKEQEILMRTGKKAVQLYFTLFNKKIYLINNLNKFNNYDKIIDINGPFSKITYYETKKKTEKIEDIDKYIENIYSSMEKDIDKYLYKNCKKVDVLKEYEEFDDGYKVWVVVIVEEDIATKKAFDESQLNEIMTILKEKRRIEYERWLKQNL
ncbi:sporulation protein YqfD [Oceanirhabdus sp. W0125-5]|uniref:sporulation protein YqfD n=1 Tax=Oceanirhabdus sp. W0125-5 TaxID=2999116 RepID=UPI0022F2CC54|nr:sporulation protein YqfD [Oceanirhabdus sp. W0125-5]WBW95772.1 sporulation protein YqfD [Oceanirhabdus sp. W0125-5]